MSLLEALRLADEVTPAPVAAHQALQVLRAALADALAMTAAKLQHAAVSYVPEIGSELANVLNRHA